MLIENLTQGASGVQKSFINSSRLRCNEVLYHYSEAGNYDKRFLYTTCLLVLGFQLTFYILY